jgi:signal transduction histidine kinase
MWLNTPRLAAQRALRQHNGQLVLQIVDDGCGFEVNRVDTDHHFGLKGMQERAAMMGGVLSVKSQPGQGTTIELVIKGI